MHRKTCRIIAVELICVLINENNPKKLANGLGYLCLFEGE